MIAFFLFVTLNTSAQDVDALCCKNANLLDIFTELDDALKNIENSSLEQVLVLDTIEMTEEKKHPKIKVLSIAKMLSKAIECIHFDRSLGRLYDSSDIYDFN